jgi:hypothetical protein
MVQAGGRPPFYETVEEMQAEIDKFINETPQEQLTITGLALSLGFSTRKSLVDYEGKEEFVNAIKKAKLRIENAYELSLRKNGRSGDIFALKNFDWKDSQDFNHGGQEGKPIGIDGRIEIIHVKP